MDKGKIPSRQPPLFRHLPQHLQLDEHGTLAFGSKASRGRFLRMESVVGGPHDFFPLHLVNRQSATNSTARPHPIKLFPDLQFVPFYCCSYSAIGSWFYPVSLILRLLATYRLLAHVVVNPLGLTVEK